MMTSNYYQTLAGKIGYIGNPLDLEGKSLMFQDAMYNSQNPEQNKKVAGQGKAPTPDQFATTQEYNNALRIYGQAHPDANNTASASSQPYQYYTPNAQTTATYNTNVDTNKTAVNNFNAQPDFQNAASLNQRYQMSNGNPVLQRGNTVVYDAQGQPLDLPIAMQQQMAFEDAINAGRSDSRSKYLGGAAPGKEYTYSDNALRKDYLNTLKNDPMFQGQGAVNGYQGYQQNVNTLQHQFDHLTGTGGIDLNYATETLNPEGQGQRGMSANEIINGQIKALGPGMSSREGTLRANDEAQRLDAMMRRVAQLAPTWSNLPIQEQIQK